MPAEGQTAINRQTGQRAVYRGGQWVVASGAPQMPANPEYPYKAPTAAADLTGKNLGNNRTVVQTRGDDLANKKAALDIARNPISEIDQKSLAEMRLAGGDLDSVVRDIGAASAAVDRFKPAPGKAASFDWFTPDENDWPLTAAAKNANFALNPFISATERDRQDYQTLLALQNQAVLNQQIAQKGPQTESDALRMKLTTVSPNKAMGENKRTLIETRYDAEMRRRRLDFYTQWANKVGSLSALDPNGRSADEAWQSAYDWGLKNLRNSPDYKRKVYGIFGSGKAPPKKAGSGWGKVEVSD